MEPVFGLLTDLADGCAAETVMALLVDEMVTKQEVVIKSLGAFMQNLPGVSDGAILGDGNIVLISDPGPLIPAAA